MLSKYRYLIQYMNKHGLHKKLDILRCWVESVTTVGKECRDYMPKGQTIVDKWLKKSRTRKNTVKVGRRYCEEVYCVLCICFF